jgi:hypothetical protein
MGKQGGSQGRELVDGMWYSRGCRVVLGNVTGYPGVFQSNPHPHLSKPVPVAAGTGCGFYKTHGIQNLYRFGLRVCIIYKVVYIIYLLLYTKLQCPMAHKMRTYGPNGSFQLIWARLACIRHLSTSCSHSYMYKFLN